MYARVGRTTEGTTGAAEVCTLHRLAGADDLVVSLWPAAADAAADPAAEWYEIEEDHPDGSPGEQPLVAALVCFDGPVSEPLHAAARRAGTERIGPCLAAQDGMVRSIVLWQPERRRMLAILLGVSVEALEDAQRAVMSTELLPGEDPALLPGPDRVDLYRVLSLVGAR